MLNLSSSTLIIPKQTLCLNGGINYLSKLPGRKVAIFASRRSVKDYVSIKKIVNNKKKFISKIFHPTWKEEPKLSELKLSMKEVFKFSPDWIVAIGGGSIIDGAKIIWALYENPNFDEKLFDIAFSVPELRKKARFVAVPTTAGTGSETSFSAVLTSEDKKKKIPIVSHDFIPDLAILDESLLKGIPLKIVIPSMLDALAHCLEGYVSKVQNALAVNLSSLALLNILNAFIKLHKGQAYEKQALMGAYYAGIIQNTNVVGPAHALAHNIPGLPHGVLTGSFLPYVIKLNMKKNIDLKFAYNRLAAGIGKESIQYILNLIYVNILPDLEYEKKLTNINDLKSKNYKYYAQRAEIDALSRFFPVKYDYKDFIMILKKIT